MRYVVIGASAAGIAAAERLRRFDPNGEIILVSRDGVSYSRCMLHLKISGERNDEELQFSDPDFFLDNRINWLKGANVTELLPDRKAIALEEGEKISYDRLLIASGASATMPPIPGLREASNAATLRNMEDAAKIAGWSRHKARCVVIGGGLVGLDVATALSAKKVEVTLVEVMGRILSLQLDAHASEKYADLLRKNGIGVIAGVGVRDAVPNGSGGVKAINLADGRSLPCDFCVVAAGVAPNIGFIKGEVPALTHNKRAVAVDGRCRTSREDVYAAGDATFLAPIWPEAVRQGRVAAENMAGGDAVLPEKSWALNNSMNFFGLPTISYGIAVAPDPSYQEIFYEAGDVYKKLVVKSGVIVGALFQGDIDNCGIYLRLVRDGVKVETLNKSLFSLNYADFFNQAANGEFL